MDLGSVADWVNALGTLLAFGGAAFASLVALRSYRLQLSGTESQVAALEAAEAARKVEAERSQASQVAFWTGVNSEGPAVWYVNRSGLPVYDLRIAVFVLENRLDFNYLAIGPYDQESILRRVRVGLMEFGANTELDEWRTLLSSRRFFCATAFRDASNRWWLRNIDGELSSVADSDQANSMLGAEAEKVARSAHE
jgi:hypothetical protein